MKTILQAAATTVALAAVLFVLFLCYQSKANIEPLFADYTPGPEIPSPQNNQAALELLSLENHLAQPGSVVPSHPDAVFTYKRQLKAIDYVRKHQLVAVPQLLCYIDYTNHFMVPVDPAHGQQLEVLTKLFPAYRALLAIPDEIPQLKAYCFDASRPFPRRITALMVLHVLDENEAHATATQMRDQEKDPARRKQLEQILEPNAWFHFYFEGAWD